MIVLMKLKEKKRLLPIAVCFKFVVTPKSNKCTKANGVGKKHLCSSVQPNLYNNNTRTEDLDIKNHCHGYLNAIL